MTRELRIIVADDEVDMREFYQSMIPPLGHKVIAAVASGEELVQRCKSLRPDLIITDIRMNGKDKSPDKAMDGIEAVARICKDEPMPVILVSAFQDNQLLERAQAEYIMGYLVKPIEQKHLPPAITVAMSRFDQFHMMRKEAADLRQALQDRKLIERAKGIIMKVAAIDEQEAFRRLQRMASDRNRRLVEVAEMMLVAEEMVRPGTEK